MSPIVFIFSQTRTAEYHIQNGMNHNVHDDTFFDIIIHITGTVLRSS